MAELPEIHKLAGQMKNALVGRTISSAAVLQGKCTNVQPGEFARRVEGAEIVDVWNKGKWIVTELSNGENILLSLGMGADVLFFENEGRTPGKYQVKVTFRDGCGYTVRFWWFGKFLLVTDEELVSEPNTKDLALDPFAERFTFEHFAALIGGRKTQVKAFLMDQKNVSGIGNMYMHDILFKAGLHPQKKVSELDDAQIRRLYDSIREVLNFSRAKGTFAYEKDFFGEPGGFTSDDFLVGYKEGKPCPTCGEAIVSIKTGSTASFICPVCQKR